MAIQHKIPPDSLTNQHIETLSQTLATVAAGIAIQWFSGPYIAVAARELYEMLFSQYTWYDPRYYVVQLPSREHVSNQAFQYGPYIVSTLLIPFIYKGIGNLTSLGKGIFKHLFSPTPQNSANLSSNSHEQNYKAVLTELKRNIDILSNDETKSLLLPLQSAFGDHQLHYMPRYHQYLSTTLPQQALNLKQNVQVRDFGSAPCA